MLKVSEMVTEMGSDKSTEEKRISSHGLLATLLFIQLRILLGKKDLTSLDGTVDSSLWTQVEPLVFVYKNPTVLILYILNKSHN